MYLTVLKDGSILGGGSESDALYQSNTHHIERALSCAASNKNHMKYYYVCAAVHVQASNKKEAITLALKHFERSGYKMEVIEHARQPLGVPVLIKINKPKRK